MVDLALVRAILEEAEAINLPGLLLVALGLGESELNPEQVGDNGHAFGVYQVHPEFHGYPAAMWLGIGGARNAIRHLWGAPGHWRDAWVDLHGDTEFARNPVYFLYYWWPLAQKSSQPTWDRCEDVLARAAVLIQQVQGEQTMGVPKPNWIWRPAHGDHYGPGHPGVSWEAVVLHITDGGDPSGWFATPVARRVPAVVGATHFSVGKDGTLRQHVSLNNAASAHGVTGEGSTAALVLANSANPNYWAIGIEHDGKSGEQPTPQQFEASAQLCAWLFQDVLLKGTATGVAVDRQHILMHADLQPKTRPDCPGWGEVTQQRYITRVRELLAVQTPVRDFRAEYEAELRGIITAAEDDKVRADVRIADAQAKLKGMAA